MQRQCNTHPSVLATLKYLANAIASVVILPSLIAYHGLAYVLGPNRAIENFSQCFALIPGLPGNYLRRAFLKSVLKHCADHVEVSFGTLFSQTGAEIEDNVYIGPGCYLGLVRLEQDVLIGAGVHIPSGGKTHFFHDRQLPIRKQGGSRCQVTIHEGAWIGSGAIILADVGPGTVVGAGSVVTKPLPANVIAAGNPARILRPRFAENRPLDCSMLQG